MIRSPRLQQSMFQLAALATLLMLFAPLLSRALLIHPLDASAAAIGDRLLHAGNHREHDHQQHHQQHRGHAHVMGGMQHAGMAHGEGAAAAHAGLPVTTSEAAASAPAPADPHAAHGEACEYCLLAARLLPWLALCILLPALPWRPLPITFRTGVHRCASRWPAHAARGPP